MDTELQAYYNDVIWCLVHYGGLEETVARQLVDESHLLEVKDEMDRALLFHELPYYWAISILYMRKNPEWHKDPTLWPPPDEAWDWVQRQTSKK